MTYFSTLCCHLAFCCLPYNKHQKYNQHPTYFKHLFCIGLSANSFFILSTTIVHFID